MIITDKTIKYLKFIAYYSIYLQHLVHEIFLSSKSVIGIKKHINLMNINENLVSHNALFNILSTFSEIQCINVLRKSLSEFASEKII